MSSSILRSRLLRSSFFLKKFLFSNAITDSKQEMAVRVGERRKRAKKVFDPSENNVPSKRKRGRPMGSANKNLGKKHLGNVSKTLKTYSHKSKSELNIESSNEEETNDANSFTIEMNNKTTGGVCSVCRQYRNPKDNSEKLVGCRDCSNKAHPPCLQGDGMLRLRPDNTWQCPHCKTCVVCIETNDAGVLTVCNVCADAYHSLCHVPPIPESLRAWNQWECKNCQETKTAGSNMDATYIEKMPGSDRSSKLSDRSDSVNRTLDRRRDKLTPKNSDNDSKVDKRNNFSLILNDSSNSFIPIDKNKSKWDYSRKLVSPDRDIYNWKQLEDVEDEDVNKKTAKKRNSQFEYKKKNDVKESPFFENDNVQLKIFDRTYQKHPNFKEDDSIDPSIPDARDWSSNDVYEYFSMYFPEQAHIFKEQDVDGRSLLLMRRNDVIHSLGLPLGPALKIFRHIVKLQTRKDDITMCWF